MPDLDFFNFFRWTLGTIVTVYATVLTLQALREWLLFLAGSDRYIGLLRRYLLVHGLRLRFRTFWGDVLICLLLCVVFGLVWRAHTVIHQIGETLREVPQ
jgi:hypothetical protein